VIMMSQNRQDSKDRLRSELDYRVNLKAEVEIEELLQRVGKIEEILVEQAMEWEGE
jgi:CRP/FNR family transcriptional regulator, cyclic AMP receptor protein